VTEQAHQSKLTFHGQPSW